MSDDASLGEHLAVIDDRDARAQLFELGQDVAADDDRLAEGAQLPEQFAELDPGARIEARCRLVEKQDLGVVDERVGEAQPLLHPARQALDVGVSLVAEIDEVEEVADHPPAAIGGDVVAASEEVEILPDLHVVVNAEHVWHEAEDATRLVGVPPHGDAGDFSLARRRRQERRENPKSRGLARPVRSDEAEDLALPTSRSRPATASVPG